MTRFLAIEIGCLECFVPTSIIGVTITPEEAIEAIEKHRAQNNLNYRDCGGIPKRVLRVFEIEVPE